jgi:MazG family protein
MDDPKARLNDQNLPSWERLKTIMAALRAPGGCAWDRKQTHQSLLPYLIEETYEVVEAIENGSRKQLKEELGDLLCQVVFHAQLADESGEFDADDIADTISDKLIRRHPHVFGAPEELDPRQVRDRWEQRKVESGEKKELLGGLPSSMPALTMAFRIGEKAGGVGFDWEKADDVIDKLDEEVDEIRQAVKSGDRDKLTDEIGDLLFATASLSRKLNIEPEVALKQALQKFRRRFGRMEEEVRRRGHNIHDLPLDDLEEIWQSIKGDD